MAFPTSLDDLDATRGTATQKLNSPSHVTHHTAEDTLIEALQTKIGVNSSAVTTSLDYYIKAVIGQWTKQVFTGDGSTTAFVLTDTPISDSIMLFYEGSLLIEDTGFTVSTKTITTLFTPEDDTKLIAWHRKIIT